MVVSSQSNSDIVTGRDNVSRGYFVAIVAASLINHRPAKFDFAGREAPVSIACAVGFEAGIARNMEGNHSRNGARLDVQVESQSLHISVELQIDPRVDFL